jgi:hypothetical protein
MDPVEQAERGSSVDESQGSPSPPFPSSPSSPPEEETKKEPKTTQYVRLYKKWRKKYGQNVFCCFGTLVTGPDINYLVLSFTLLFVPSALTLAFV